MSWSINFIGTPERVAAALEGYVEKVGLSGPSKEEYEKALPNMVSLVKQNFGNENELVQIAANGSGYIENGVPKTSRCNVNITTIYGALV